MTNVSCTPTGLTPLTSHHAPIAQLAHVFSIMPQADAYWPELSYSLSVDEQRHTSRQSGHKDPIASVCETLIKILIL